MNIVYRYEDPKDISKIESVTKSAFLDHPHGDGNETKIISSLRQSDALAISLVAEVEGKIIGHIAFSAIDISDGTNNWFALGPVSVLPEHQCHSIGTSLVKKGIEILNKRQAGGCVLVGEPDYYKRFGFRAVSDLTLEGLPTEYFQCLLLSGAMPKGKVSYHKCFFE